jgi:very-short-patch-repair endonuclease
MREEPIIFSRKPRREKIERSKSLRHGMTKPERMMWGKLRAHRLCGLHFRRQAVINPYIVDFYCHSVKLVVEMDGRIHDGQKEMDAERDRFLIASGVEVLRFPNRRVLADINGVVAEIESVCMKKKTPPLSPPQNGEG